MKKAQSGSKLNPYWRFEEAVQCVRKPACAPSDIWVRKLCAILRLRDKFRVKYKDESSFRFAERFPLYSDLLAAFENTTPGGSRDLLEAVLIASPDFKMSAKTLDHPRFDSLFIGLYKQLFFDLSYIAGNRIAEFQCFITPMLEANSSKIAIGHIWKLLALTGGMPLLMRKGLGTEVIGGEDVNYLLQLAAFRHCSEIMRYASIGSDLFKENPGTAPLLATLADMHTVRGRGRRNDWLAEIKEVVRNNINTLLSGELKLLSAPAKDKLLKLAEIDGQFCPQLEETMETTKHIIYTDGESEKSNA